MQYLTVNYIVINQYLANLTLNYQLIGFKEITI